MNIHHILCALLVIGQSVACPANEFTFVADGKAQAPIVVPRRAVRKSGEPDFSAPAADLKELVRKISGASPDVLTMEEWKQRTPATAAIFMGCAPAGNELPPVTDEEDSRVQSCKDGLVFAVNAKVSAELQQSAMQHAVNRFAEETLGCRWLMPGELGEVIPRRTTIALTDIALEEKPVFWSRRMRDRQAAGHVERLAKVRQSLDAEDKAGAAKPMGESASAGEWLERMNMGRRFPFEFGHSFGGWWDQFDKTHPEFFALQPDGTRTQHPPRERLCESQPKLWDQVAANAIAAFDADPGLRMFSICENDGGQNRFCMCERCMALDAPGAPKVTDQKIYNPKTGAPFAEGYPSLSDRVFTFFNEVARRVKQKYPDRYLGTYAYSVYRTVPVNIAKLEDNLIVSVVSDDPAQVEAWSKLAPKMFVRPNTFWDGKMFGIVRNDARRLGRLVQTAASHHVLGFDWDGMIGNWASQGLNYYVVGKLLWNPTQDIEALITDYLESAYGKASTPAMRRYFDKLEVLTGQAASDPKYQGRKVSPAPLLAHYTDARLAELAQCVAEAREATASGSPEQRRVELVQQALEYTQHVCSMIAHLSNPSTRTTYEAEWKKQAPYFAELARNPYFGTEQNLTKLSPALKGIERRGRKGTR